MVKGVDGMTPEVMFQSTSGSDFLRLKILEIISDDSAVEALIKTPEFYRGVKTAISLRAGNFTYETLDFIYVGEYVAFAEELSSFYETLSGTATFIAPDIPISITLNVDGLGHVTLAGEALDLHGSNKLTFGFDMDQTSLVPVLGALRQFIAIAAPTPVPG